MIPLDHGGSLRSLEREELSLGTQWPRETLKAQCHAETLRLRRQMADKDQEIHALRSLVASTAEELETARLRLTCAWAHFVFQFFPSFFHFLNLVSIGFP